MAFVDFPAQGRVAGMLQRSLGRGRLGHAYLFVGDALPTLEAVARTLAKTLHCSDDRARPRATALPDCCDRCSSCRRVDDSLHPDVLWVRPESKSRVISIDQVREVIHTVSLKPTEGTWKVAVMVGADRMNAQAANAFLKTLEEPPGRSVLILLSTQPQRLLETILSRCLRLSFAGLEKQALDPGLREWILGFAQALSAPSRSLLGRYQALGSLLSRLTAAREAIEKDLTARSPLERWDDTDARLQEKWEDELKAAVEAEYRRQRSELLAGLQWFFRDVWLKTLKAGDELLSMPDLSGAAAGLSARLQPAEALENLRLLVKAQQLLETNAQEALVLEVSLLKLRA